MNCPDCSPLGGLPVTRRQALQRAACGFGYLALAGLASRASAAIANPLAPKQPHFKARAKRIVFIFMQGGPSHVDSFDYKPRLEKDDGKMMPFDDARTFARTRNVIEHRVMKNLWRFRQYGESGKWVSALFPHIAEHVDDICFLQGMHT